MPTTDSHPPGSGETIIRRTTTKISSKVPWLPLILAALIVPLLLTALATLTGIGKRDTIQDDLSERTVQALEAEGITGADVSFDGRDGTISGLSGDHAAHAKDIVLGVDGVRVADVKGAGGDGASAPLTIDSADDKITLSGEVPDEATKAELIEAATAKADGREVVDELTVKDGAKSSMDATGVGTLVEAIEAAGGDISVQAGGDTVTLSGEVPSEDAKAAVEEKAKEAAPNATVDNQLTVDEEKAALQIAAALESAPEVKIEVDGHVADVAGVKPDQQTLSELRADAVKDKLVELGVAADRITTKGFGGSEPVEPNNTSEGQAANRRVEIIVL